MITSRYDDHQDEVGHNPDQGLVPGGHHWWDQVDQVDELDQVDQVDQVDQLDHMIIKVR